MSESGHLRHFCPITQNVCSTPMSGAIADIAEGPRCATSRYPPSSLDDLVGAGEKGGRNCEV